MGVMFSRNTNCPPKKITRRGALLNQFLLFIVQTQLKNEHKRHDQEKSDSFIATLLREDELGAVIRAQIYLEHELMEFVRSSS